MRVEPLRFRDSAMRWVADATPDMRWATLRTRRSESNNERAEPNAVPITVPFFTKVPSVTENEQVIVGSILEKIFLTTSVPEMIPSALTKNVPVAFTWGGTVATRLR